MWYRLTSREIRHELLSCVWFHTVQCNFRTRGWLTAQGQKEIDEAEAAFREAESRGIDIPSIAEAFDYFNRV